MCTNCEPYVTAESKKDQIICEKHVSDDKEISVNKASEVLENDWDNDKY